MIWTSEERQTWLRDDTVANRRILTEICDSPLGAIDYAGYIRGGRGVSTGKLRVLGRYALVIVADGSALYRDATGFRRKLSVGDALFLMPELGHGYGPSPGGRWSEFHIVFGGPVFDLCRNGLFDTSDLIYSLNDLHGWLDQFEEILSARIGGSIMDTALAVSKLLSLITQILATRPRGDGAEREPDWLLHAKQLIEERLSSNLSVAEVAAGVGLSYDGFRKSFGAATAQSPTQYHFDKRIEAACALLKHTRMTNRQIADSLGFCDEYHFSSRFHAKTGLRPGIYRRKQQEPAQSPQ